MSNNTNVWARGRRFSRFPAETSSGTKNGSAEAVGNIANGNIQKSGTVKKEDSPAVSLTLSLNPDWGDFEVDINHNADPIAITSTPVTPCKLAESHPLPKKEVTTVGSKLEVSYIKKSEKASLIGGGVKNADQVLFSKTKLVSMAVSLRKLADELLSLVDSA